MFHQPVSLSSRAFGMLARLAVLALLFGAGPAKAADPLSLDRALRLAQDRSLQLVGQDAAAAAARDLAVAAGQRPDPTLKAGIIDLPVDTRDRFSLTRDSQTMRAVSVMQELTRGSKLEARAARFERDAEVAAARRELALANLQRDTATAWLDRLYQERVRDVLVEQRNEARLQIEAADAAYKGARGSQADAFATRSAVAQIDDRIAQAERQVATAKTMLSRWTGPVAEPLGSAPSMESVRLRAEDLETQLAHHPEIAVLVRQEASAQAEVEVAKLNKKPDVSVELMYGQRGPAYSNMVSLTLSMPLQWNPANRQDREVSAKLAVVEQLRDEREEETRMHVAQALAMIQEWRSDRERLVRYDNALLPLASERVRASFAAYRGNAGSLSAVLEARRGEIDMRIERLRLEMDAARLWAQLNYLVPVGSDMTMGARP